MAELSGIELPVPFEFDPITLEDEFGKPHTFHLVPSLRSGVSLEAVELLENDDGGWQRQYSDSGVRSMSNLCQLLTSRNWSLRTDWEQCAVSIAQFIDSDESVHSSFF